MDSKEILGLYRKLCRTSQATLPKLRPLIRNLVKDRCHSVSLVEKTKYIEQGNNKVISGGTQPLVSMLFFSLLIHVEGYRALAFLSLCSRQEGAQLKGLLQNILKIRSDLFDRYLC